MAVAALSRQTLLSALVCGTAAALAALPACTPNSTARTEAKTAAPSIPVLTEYVCRFTESPIEIDGKGDEAAWKEAVVIDNFSMPWLGVNNHRPHQATRAKLLWDREYVYFLADMDDTDIYANVTEHDGPTFNNDVFEIFFKPADDKPGYYEFEFSANNTTMDMFLPRRAAGGLDRFGKDGEFHMKTAVSHRGTLNRWQDKDEGWSVEGRVPWKDFLRTGGRPNVDEKWKFTLCRYDYSIDFEGPDLSTCSPLQRLDFHNYEGYSAIRFAGPPSSKPVGIEKRVPLTTSRVVGFPDPPLPYRAVKGFPDLKIKQPLAIHNIPGTKDFLIVKHNGAWNGPGTLLWMPNDPGVKEATELLTINRIAYDISFHPDFKNNGYIYVGNNGLTPIPNNTTRISRFTMKRERPYTIDPKSELIVIEWPSDGHNGGGAVFGNDGMLYVTSGDGTSDSDKNQVGQKLDNLNSKVLRIDVDRPADGKNYSVPKDNPFVGVEGARPETWCFGMRNPWRMTYDKASGQLWVGQNGQDLWEQAYLIEKGKNYGWSAYEGSHPFYVDRLNKSVPLSPPTVEHPHSEARSLTGGIVYRGSKLPELIGAYVYGDWSTGRIWGVKHDGTKIIWHHELARSPIQITGFGADENGELLVVDQGGNFYRLEPTPKDQPQPPFPRKLSETGLFASTSKNEPQPALVPYDVNSPLWSDGAIKERFIAIPGDGKIDYATNRGWTFPEGSVLVKTFALETEAGKPESKKRIETRLITLTQGQWYGYSYIWDDRQSDATLVDAAGADKQFVIADAAAPGGKRTQTWHYPSRSECMACHTRAVGFVLGLSQLQMNRDHDYHGVKANQLRTLESLGMIRFNDGWYETDQLYHAARPKVATDEEAWKEVGKMTDTRDQREAVLSALLPRAPEQLPKLVDPMNKSADLTARARSYLHANCAHCHVEAGGGNAKIDLEFLTSAVDTHAVDEAPMHDAFGIPEPRILAPGSAERSTLYHRVAINGPGQMPPLARSVVDAQAVALLQEWIAQLQPVARPEPAK
jgi:glucose/arabinose dehydrogenase